MHIFWVPNHADHITQGEIKDGILRAPFEHPGRIDGALGAMKAAGLPRPLEAPEVGIEPILAVHDVGYIGFLNEAWPRWRAEGRTGDIVPLVWPGRGMRHDTRPLTIDGKIGHYCFDAGTPICRDSWDISYASAQCAVAAADRAAAGEHAFAMTRPPGHHAMRAGYGGYCFVNNAAVAAERMIAEGCERVAVLDVDYHHGNGTQSIFYERADVLVVNIHADPIEEYPYYLGHSDEQGDGKGFGANVNLPLAKGSGWGTYRHALDTAISTIRSFEADALVVSFGADTYEDDPLGTFTLGTNHIGMIADAIAGLRLPSAIILEGGYATDALGDNIAAFLTPFA